MNEEFEYGDKNVEFGIDRSKQGSSFTAFFSVVCVVAGTGALGLPYALALGGWIGLFILGLSWLLSICKYMYTCRASKLQFINVCVQINNRYWYFIDSFHVL